MVNCNTIAIFDIGKTNKKLFLFDEEYRVVFEKSERLPEIADEDGDACEDLDALIKFVHDALKEVLAMLQYQVKAVNFSAYGASFVHVDEKGIPVAPLYNYLKPMPAGMVEPLHEQHGGADSFSLQTASPALGSLNSGLQLLRIKKLQPALFGRIKHSLHLPQFLSSLVTKRFYSEITSIGCHTALWNFTDNYYHQWVTDERVDDKLPLTVPTDMVMEATVEGQEVLSGPGLHDSSAALIPYLLRFKEPFVLISTGTWSISLNPFNKTALTAEELAQDCLCYLTYKGDPVKASRLFAGNEHEYWLTLINEYFSKSPDYYKQVKLNPDLMERFCVSPLVDFNFEAHQKFEEAYHALIWRLVLLQKQSTLLVIDDPSTKKIFVDGGFSQNELFMTMLAAAMPDKEIYSASMPQASALGAAMAIHRSWNTKSLRNDIIALKPYTPRKQAFNQ